MCSLSLTLNYMDAPRTPHSKLPDLCAQAQVPPQPGQVLLGYELYKPRVGPCMCDGLSMAGLISGGAAVLS